MTGEMLWLSPRRVVFAPVRSFDRIRVYNPALRLMARGELLAASDATLAGDRLLALAGSLVVEASPPAARLTDLTALPSPVVNAIEPVPAPAATATGRPGP